MKHDITTAEDIKLMVDKFYDLARADILIGPIFNDIIKDWGKHLPKMYSFWGSMLLAENTYEGSPMAPHMSMPIEKEHFDRWVELFKQNVDNLFEGSKADEAKLRGESIAQLFHFKKEQMR